MSLVSQAVAMIGKTRPRTDSDRLKKISSQLRQIASDETVVLNNHIGSNALGDIVLEYDDQYRTDQMMLWIDGVGGYLICLADEIVLGQPNMTSHTMDEDEKVSKISLLADISSRHLRIRRESGGYLLLPHGPTKINGREIDLPTRLDDGAVITLSDTVRLRFTRPHALSSTALLTVVSDHRTDPAADGVVLMAESCVLGPKSHSHLRCPRWENEVILFRSSEGLLFRSSQVQMSEGQTKSNINPSGIQHNGLIEEEPVALSPNSRIEGQDFSLTIEGVIKGGNQ